MKDKTLYILIGPKGSGKSYIGTLLDNQFNIHFVRVENWVKAIKQKVNIDDEAYLKEVFHVIEGGIRKVLRYRDNITFESTGLTKYFDQMLENLSNDFNVITVRVTANPKLCLERVRSRDQSIHVSISDNDVQYINQRVVDKVMNTDFEIDNNNKSETELLFELNKITTPQQWL